MEGIYEPNAEFPFDKLVLTPPTLMSGGNYFIKFIIDGSPLYLQPPKCKTKNGITKSGKKPYTDLLFTNENQDYISWMENLESYICKTIYENRSKWFETDMELQDIENYFVSPLKIYKSGKFYLARTNIPTRLGKMALSIYDENENLVEPESIQETTNLLTILEIQGIKCSARSFQLEMEVKQMMVLKPSNLFEKCIIKSTVPEKKEEETLVKTQRDENSEQLNNESSLLVNSIQENMDSKYEEEQPKQDALGLSDILDDDDKEETPQESSAISNSENVDDSLEIESDLESLAEFNLDIESVPETETVQLKQRNDVYYELYKQARRKARHAKKMALSSYLEAKRIKNTYMLDDILDSDSDTDSNTEFDESDISES
jgi:hypothetical protein